MEIMRECTGESLKEKVLAMTIEELNFSVRTFNCLKRAGLDTVGDLAQLTEDELYHVRNLGKKSSEEVLRALLSLGLYLRDFDDEPPRKIDRKLVSITELHLPYRIKKCLIDAGIYTIKDLTAKTIDEIANLPYLGYKDAKVIVDKVEALGYSLADNGWNKKTYVVANTNGENVVIHAATSNEQLANTVYQRLCEKYEGTDLYDSLKMQEFSDRGALDLLFEEPKELPDNVMVTPCATFEFWTVDHNDSTPDVRLSRISDVESCIVIIPSKDPHGMPVKWIMSEPEGRLYPPVVDWWCTDELMGLVVPEGVEYIGSSAFERCPQLNCVSLPNTLNVIHDHAFSSCTKLESITIPENVTYISSFAFYGCTKLQSVKLPAQLNHIGRCAFANCPNLRDIEIPEGCKVEPDAFKDSPNALKILAERHKSGSNLYEALCDLTAAGISAGIQNHINSLDMADEPSLADCDYEEYFDDCEDEVEYFNGFGDEDDYYEGEE